MYKKTAELIFSGICLVASSGLFIHTFFSNVHMAGSGVEHSPMFFPRIILGLMVLLSFGMLSEAIVKAQGYQPKQNWGILAGAVALVGFLVVSFNILGFIVSSFLFLIGYGYLLGYRKKRFLIIISASATLVIWYTFNTLLTISLPEFPGLINF